MFTKYIRIRHVKCIVSLLFLTFHVPLMAQDSYLEIDSNEALYPTFSIDLSQHKTAEFAMPEDPKGLLALFLVSNEQVSPVPVTGKYAFEEGQLSLRPLIKLGEGLTFKLVYKKEMNTLEFVYKTPKAVLPYSDPPKVLNIFPGESAVPENILCFHVLFDRPMSQDIEAYREVRIFHDDEEVPLVWKHAAYWTQNGQLLVLMVHPGRVKRGISYLGKAFNSGNTYSLVVGKNIADAHGRMLTEETTKQFGVTNADHKVPKIRKRQIQFPENQDQSPVIVSFSEPMDYACMVEGTRLLNKQGDEVKFKVEHVNDQLYLFRPEDDWRQGSYQLVMTNVVGDLCGNRFHRKFETTSKPGKKQMESRKTLEFIIH